VWNSPPGRLTVQSAATLLHRMLEGRTVVGAVPNFDTERLALFMRKHLGSGYRDPWHYHLMDVENLAVGYLHGYGGDEAPADLLLPPWDSDELTEALGLGPAPEHERHTALGDCRWARSIYDRVTGGHVV
jgi:hypothetical protein